MTIKEQVLDILQRGREVELAFMQSLSEEEKTSAGTFEKWSIKDAFAHVHHWIDYRARRIKAWVNRETMETDTPFEEANNVIYEKYANKAWEEIEALADSAHKTLIEVVQAIDEETLNGPSERSESRKVWEDVIGIAYDHKFTHIADIYHERGQKEQAGELWKEWAAAVAPLDPGPDWQGRVHYNAACSLALAGDANGALESLRKCFELSSGSMKTWSRLDADLALLHDMPEYRDLFAPGYWWDAFEANPQAEALADQFMRFFSMLRIAVSRFEDGGWREGDSLYQRPVGLALHAAQSVDFYAALKAGDNTGDPLTNSNWQDRDASRFPSQEEFLSYLDKVEEKVAQFLAQADLLAEEEFFPWTGKTVLGRAIYSLRHAQHHLADLAMELQRRGLRPPDWQ